MIKRTRDWYFNSDTATKILSWREGREGDGTWVVNTLYRNRTGTYFLHSRGGENSAFAKRSPYGAAKPGESVVPLSLEDRRKVVYDHGDREAVDLVERLEGEDAGRSSAPASKHIRLSPEAARKLEKLARRYGASQSAVVDQLIVDADEQSGSLRFCRDKMKRRCKGEDADEGA